MLSEVFKRLQQTSSTTDKLRILQEAYKADKELVSYALVLALDPYKKFKHPSYFNVGKGTGAITLEWLQQLDAPEIDWGYINKSVRAMSPDEAEVAVGIITKKPRIGVSTALVNKVFPGLISSFEVMLAQPIDFKTLQYPCLATTKIDGLRCIIKANVAYTRRGHELKGLEEYLKQINSSYILDCEVTVPGMNFQESSGLLRSHHKVSNVQFTLLDTPSLPHIESFEERMATLKTDKGLDLDFIKIVPYKVVNSEAELSTLFSRCVFEGYEGLVVRPLCYPYQHKRSKYWQKLKVKETLDLRIIDCVEGTGKYKGMLGAFTVQYKEAPVRVGTGFTDTQRLYFWDKRTELIGQIAEVEYHEITPTGSLRHPRFIRLRWDKCCVTTNSGQ